VEAAEPRLPERGRRGEVEFRGVRLSYLPEEEVLHGIDLKVRPGERVALVGATGSGKTSLARLLVRLYDTSAGAVLLDGVDVRDWPVRELRRHVALVLQEPFLFSGTILENIRLEDRSVPEERVMQAARTLGADGLVRRFPGGYDYPVREGGTNLSHGERQLVSFARALVHDPEVLVLDEATSSVDSETERVVEEAMGRLLRGRTSLVIAHRLSTVRAADRIVVLHHGEVREQGSHQELMAAGGIYSRLWRLQFEPLESGGAA
jgi:ATP-binding cassette subfamily B protein